jgi:hypothetical protein
MEYEGSCVTYFRAPQESDGCGFVAGSYAFDEVEVVVDPFRYPAPHHLFNKGSFGYQAKLLEL